MTDDRPDPLAPPEGYGVARLTGIDAPVTHLVGCCFGQCWMTSAFCVYLGDENEHIGHLCLCPLHCEQHQQRRVIECTICHQPMKIIQVVPKPGANPYEPLPEGYDTSAGLQKLLDWITDYNREAGGG